MLTINIMKLEVNTISNVGSLNIGKAIVCYNRAVSKEITTSNEQAALPDTTPSDMTTSDTSQGLATPPAPVVTPVVPPASVVPPTPPSVNP